MAAAGEIKARIATITETKKVTDAMYMIASVKMRRAKKAVQNTEPYFRALKEELGELFLQIPNTENPFFRTHSDDNHRRAGILLVTSDKGLAGAYNNTALQVAEEYMGRHPELKLFIVGEYGRQYCLSRKIPFVEEFGYAACQPSMYQAEKICQDLLEYYRREELNEIHIIYTDYQNGKPGQCRRSCLLPLERSRFSTPDRQRAEHTKQYYPDADTVLNGIIPGYLAGFIYSCLVDSYCSEQQARMSAMSTAGKNAEEMLKKLRVEYNTLRQAAITREMTEITSGARALKRKRRPQRSNENG